MNSGMIFQSHDPMERDPHHHNIWLFSHPKDHHQHQPTSPCILNRSGEFHCTACPLLLYRALTCTRGHTMVCICTVTFLFQCYFLFSKGLTSGKGQVWPGLDCPFTRYLRPKPQDCLSDLTTLLLLFPPSAHLGSIIPHLLFRAQHRHPCSPVLQAFQAPCSTSHPCPGPGGPVLHLYTEPHGPLQTHILSALAA